jgi:hypothetical protein
LLAQRQKLKSDKEKILVQIKAAEDAHQDTTDLKKQLDALNTQDDNATKEALELLASKVDNMNSGGDKAAQVTAREARVAERETAVTQREKDQDKRFAAELTALKETVNAKCGGETIVQQISAPPPPSGHSYAKKDVDDRLKHARDVMFKRGILTGDLPGPAQGLETESTHAEAENDLSKAYALANQLALQVDAIQINSAFIRAKITRLQAQLKAGKPDDTTQAELAAALTDVMNFFGNGKYDLANQRAAKVR